MVFLPIILFIGIFTTFTDLKSNKIYNLHLAIGAAGGLAAVVYTTVYLHENALYHISCGLIAFMIGALLHRSSLWRGGDAKLFALYALLMPTPAYDHIFFPSVISLFACSFVAGTLILIPAFMRDIIINHNVIMNDLFSPVKRQALFFGIMKIIFFSWILFPFFTRAGITNPIIVLTLMYFIFSWRYGLKKKVREHYILDFFTKGLKVLVPLFLFGLVMHLWLLPHSLSFHDVTRYLIMVTLSATISICIQTTFDHFKDYHDRVPFAPLLFLGCVLSYTPFLTKLVHVLVQWNGLLHR